MTKTLRNLVTAGAVGLGVATGMPAERAEAQVAGNVEYIQSEKNEKSFARGNIFYGLPQNVNGFSFIEFYKNGDGYFGKTMLNRPIVSGLGPKVEGVHNGELLSRVGLGASFSVPGMPKGSYANLGILPVWLSEEGKRLQAQYAFGFKLPKGFYLSSFGEMNLRAEPRSVTSSTGEVNTKTGPRWGYGEAELTKSFGPFEVGYNMRLYDDGNASPKHQHGAVVTLNIRGKKIK